MQVRMYKNILRFFEVERANDAKTCIVPFMIQKASRAYERKATNSRIHAGREAINASLTSRAITDSFPAKTSRFKIKETKQA